MKWNYNHRLILLFFVLKVSFLAFSQRFSASSDIIAFCESVESENRLVGELNVDSLPSLPIGIHKNIAGVDYTIAVDSARFLTNGAYFDAYMALGIPGLENKIAFRATNIQFNPKGVIGGGNSKLYLAEDQRIRFGPNISMLFPGDGSNYVEWDCNGFKAVNLKAVFEFSRELIEPLDTSSCVRASFEVYTSDVRNILITANISPFQLKGKNDFQFFVSEAVVDLSDDSNPAGAVFPDQILQVFGNNIQNWRGFYLKSIEVVLPEALSKGDERISIGANDLIIDNSGVSGEFFINNLLSPEEGDLSGWPFSVSRLETEFVCNKIVRGSIEGVIKIPAVEQTDLEYGAEIFEDSEGKLGFNFLLSPTDPLYVKSANAEFTLDPSTRLEVSIYDGKFKPVLTASGNLSILKNKTEIVGMEFQEVRFVTEAPYITDGIFSLTTNGDSSKMENFKIQLDRFFIQFSETAPVFGADVRLSLGGGSQGNTDGTSLSVATGFRIYTSITEIPPNEYQYHSSYVWEYDRLEITDIALEVETNALHLNGVLSFRRNDPVYGDGFFGSLLIKIDQVLEQGMSATFFAGKVDDYRYWFVDISVPLKIPIGNTGLSINKLRGGASYHVKDNRTKEQLIAAANQGSFAPANAYVPDKNKGLMLRAGVGLDWVNESVLNADVLFSITFNTYGGFDEVYFMGHVYCMVNRATRSGSSNKIEGSILVHYDNVEKVLDAQVSAEINYANIVEGNMHLKVFVSPDLWFFKLNTPSNPAHVNLLDLAYIDTYLMIGQGLEPSLPPPSTVMDLVGIESSESRDQNAMILGNGFAHGARLQVGGEVSVGWQNFSIYGALDIGAGYDLTIYNYGNSVRCEGRPGPIGLKGWYLQGQIYAYIGFGIGIRGRIFGSEYDLPLIEAYLAMYLAGKLPKPTYVEGGVGVRATLIGVFNVNFNLNFSVGENCNLIQT